MSCLTVLFQTMLLIIFIFFRFFTQKLHKLKWMAKSFSCSDLSLQSAPLSPVHTVAEKCDCTVAEKCDCRRCLAVFGDSHTFLQQSHFSATVWTGLKATDQRSTEPPVVTADHSSMLSIEHTRTLIYMIFIHQKY